MVVGGGRVAARKLRALLECRAEIKVISPEICQEVKQMADGGELTLIHRKFRPGDLAGAMLCIAATNCRTVQDAVRDEAARAGILLNSISGQDACNFQVPARLRRGSLLLTVSTGGGSPALSRAIRLQLEEQFGPEYDDYVRFLALIREHLLAVRSGDDGLDCIFENLIRRNYLTILADKNWDRLEKKLLADLPAGADPAVIIERFKVLSRQDS